MEAGCFLSDPPACLKVIVVVDILSHVSRESTGPPFVNNATYLFTLGFSPQVLVGPVI